MRNPSDVDVDKPDRDSPGAASRRSVLAPDVVPVDLPAGGFNQGERLPFAPGREPRVVSAAPATSLIALTAFRWRRPLMAVLVIAIAASVALAAQRQSTVDNGNGRASGEMGATATGDGAVGAGRATNEIASEASGDGTVSRFGAEEAETGSAESPDGDPAPLQVTATSSPAMPVGEVGSGSSAAAAVGETSHAPQSTTTQPSSTQPSSTQPSTQPSSTQPPTTASARAATTEKTTSPVSTRAERTTTIRRTTTTVVLVGTSDGGFENPAIGQDMIWLENGDVGRWRSTNGDIQLMRSGFEGITSVDGGQFAELNSSSQGGLYRDLPVEPGTVISWEFLHRARNGSEQIEVRIGPRSSEEPVDTVQATTRWVSQSGRWRVPEGVTSVRFMLWSTESGPYGNLVDAVRVEAAEG